MYDTYTIRRARQIDAVNASVVQNNDQGMITVTTTVEPTSRGLSAKDQEVAHRQDMAAAALRDMRSDVRGWLNDAPDSVQSLLQDGTWRKAAEELDRLGMRGLASWLRLETPFGLEL